MRQQPFGNNAAHLHSTNHAQKIVTGQSDTLN